MGRLVDRAFCALLAFGTLGHLAGTFVLVEPGSGLFVWSLAGALAAALLTALNILRSVRPSDKAVSWIAFGGDVAWIGVAILFGRSIGNVLDARVLLHALAAAGLAVFSFQDATAQPRREK